MIEPRQLRRIDGGNVVNMDVYHDSFTRRTEIDENTLFSKLGVSGTQVPLDFAV